MLPHTARARLSRLAVCCLALAFAACDMVSHGQPEAARPSTPAPAPGKPRTVEVVAFTAKWCGYCQKVPALLTQLRAAAPAGVTLREIDVDRPGDAANAALVKKYAPGPVPFVVYLIDDMKFKSIRGLPTFEHAKSFLDDTTEARDRMQAFGR